MKKFRSLLLAIMLCISSFATAACSCGSKKVETLTINKGFNHYYEKDSEPDFSNLKLTAKYNDGTIEENITSDKVTFSDFSTKEFGTFDLDITYKNKTITTKMYVVPSLEDEEGEISSNEAGESIAQYFNRSVGKAIDKTPTIIDENKEGLFALPSTTKDTLVEGIEENPYIVGDDNLFKLDLVSSAIDINGNISDRPITTKTTLYIFDDEQNKYVEVSDTTKYVTIDNKNTSYQFKPEADGHFFKIKVVPANLTTDQVAKDYDVNFEFKVVDGFNVYNAVDLGILYNVHSNIVKQGNVPVDIYGQWLALLKNNNVIDEDVNEIPSVNSIVLHRDLKVTPKDIPEGFLIETDGLTDKDDTMGEPTNTKALYKAKDGKTYALNDSLDDKNDVCESSSIYCHKVESTADQEKATEFSIFGNYFTIDAQEIPTIDTGLYEAWGSTSPLFRFVSNSTGKEHGYADPSEDAVNKADYDKLAKISANAVVNMVNLNTMGNAIRTAMGSGINEDSAMMGGLLFAKAHGTTLKVKNSIIKGYLVELFLEERFSRIETEYVKCFDAYQDIIHSHAGGTLDAKMSQFVRAGGPVMIITTSNNEFKRNSVHIVVDKDTKLQSLVNGNEPWFHAQGQAPVATKLLQLSGTFAELSKPEKLAEGQETYESSSYVKNGMANTIAAVLLNGDAPETGAGCTYVTPIVKIERVIDEHTTKVIMDTRNPIGLVGEAFRTSKGAPYFQKGYTIVDGVNKVGGGLAFMDADFKFWTPEGLIADTQGIPLEYAIGAAQEMHLYNDYSGNVRTYLADDELGFNYVSGYLPGLTLGLELYETETAIK